MIQNSLLEAARVDIGYATMGLNSGDDGFTGVAGFHVQQAVEKILKAGLVFYGVEYKKVHDIGMLLQMTEKVDCWMGDDLWDWLELASPLLTSWENKPRYGEVNYLIALRTVSKHLDMAKQLHRVAISLFEKLPTEKDPNAVTIGKLDLS